MLFSALVVPRETQLHRFASDSCRYVTSITDVVGGCLEHGQRTTRVAVVSMIAAVIVTNAAGLPVRDPDHVAGKRLLALLALVALLFALDVAVRAARRTGRRIPSRTAMAEVRRERWTLARGVAVGTALVSFYASYLAYRNLKSVVPLDLAALYQFPITVTWSRFAFAVGSPALAAIA